MFGPLEKRESVVDACAHQLERAILSGELRPGGRLPAERKLAESMGVNRVTVRSALARLETAGLVSVRQGSGYRVEDYRKRGGPGLIRGLVEAAGGPGELITIATDLLAIRRQLAGAVLAQLADGVSDEALARIEEKVNEFEAATKASAGSAELAERDLAVLRAIIEATGSEVFALFMNPIAQLVGEFTELREAIYADPDQSAHAYRQLLLWLKIDQRKPIQIVLDLMAGRDAHTIARLRGEAS